MNVNAEDLDTLIVEGATHEQLRAAADGNRYGREGIAATCMPSETGAMLSWRMDVPA